TVGEFARGHTLRVRLHPDRGAVLIGAADHQDRVTGHSLEPGEHVAREPESGYVADVARSVGVRPRRRGENVTAGHAVSLGVARLVRSAGQPQVPCSPSSHPANSALPPSTVSPPRLPPDPWHLS